MTPETLTASQAAALLRNVLRHGSSRTTDRYTDRAGTGIVLKLDLAGIIPIREVGNG